MNNREMINSMWIDFLKEIEIIFDGDLVTIGGQQTLVEHFKISDYFDMDTDCSRLALFVKYNEKDVIWLDFLAMNTLGTWRLCDGLYSCELIKGPINQAIIQMVEEREYLPVLGDLNADFAWGTEAHNYIEVNRMHGLIKSEVGLPEMYDNWNQWHEHLWVLAGEFFE